MQTEGGILWDREACIRKREHHGALNMLGGAVNGAEQMKAKRNA